MYVTEEASTPLARSAWRWRAPLPLSVLALGALSVLWLAAPSLPGLRALFPSRDDLATTGAAVPMPLAIGIALLGAAALAWVLSRLVRGVETRPYESIAPVLAVLAGVLYLSLRVELPLAGLPSAQVGGGVLALALMGGALVYRERLRARMLGWALVLVPVIMIALLVATSAGQGMSLGALRTLDAPVRAALGLLIASALLLGLAGVFARTLRRKAAFAGPSYDDDGSGWSAPSPDAQVGAYPSLSETAAAASLGTTMPGWGTPNGQDAQGAADYGAQGGSGYGYAQPQSTGYDYSSAQASYDASGYGSPAGNGSAQPGYDASGYSGAGAGYDYGNAQASAYQQSNGYGSAPPSAAGYDYGSAQAGAYQQGSAYQQSNGYGSAPPSAAGYDYGSAQAGAYQQSNGYGSAPPSAAGYDYGSAQASAYGQGSATGYPRAAPGYNAPAEIPGYNAPAAAYGGHSGSASAYQSTYASHPGYQGPAGPPLGVPRRSHAGRAFIRLVQIVAAVIAAAVGAYWVVYGLSRVGDATTAPAGATQPPPPGVPVVEQLSPDSALARPAPSPRDAREERRRHRAHRQGKGASERRAAKSEPATSPIAKSPAPKASPTPKASPAPKSSPSQAARAPEPVKQRATTRTAPVATQPTRAATPEGFPSWDGSGRPSTPSRSTSTTSSTYGRSTTRSAPVDTSASEPPASSAPSRTAPSRTARAPAPEPSAPVRTTATAATRTPPTPPPAPAAPPKPAAPSKPLTMDQLLERVAPAGSGKKPSGPKSQRDQELDDLLEKSLKPKK